MNFTSVKQWTIPEGEVLRVIDNNDKIIWSKESPDLSSQFYIENISPSRSIGLVFHRSSANPTLQKSTDGITWTTLCSTDNEYFLIPPSTKYYVRATGYLNPTSINLSNPANTRIASYEDPISKGNQPALKIGGNVSTIYNTVLGQHTATSQKFLFYGLFANNKEVYDISDIDFRLIDHYVFDLSSHTGLQYTFADMFNGCTNLAIMPVRIIKAFEFWKFSKPNATINIWGPSYFYYRLFYGCTSITSTPWICTEVDESYITVKAGNLHGNYTYAQMFSGCTSLNEIKVSNGRDTSNFTMTIFDTQCVATVQTKTATTEKIFSNVGNSGTFKIPSSLRNSGYSSWDSFVPSGWTIVEV